MQIVRCGWRASANGPDGASPATAMTHIAIEEALQGTAVEWLDHVSVARYDGRIG